MVDKLSFQYHFVYPYLSESRNVDYLERQAMYSEYGTAAT
jgi:hypothetical protein